MGSVCSKKGNKKSQLLRGSEQSQQKQQQQQQKQQHQRPASGVSTGSHRTASKTVLKEAMPNDNAVQSLPVDENQSTLASKDFEGDAVNVNCGGRDSGLCSASDVTDVDNGTRVGPQSCWKEDDSKEQTGSKRKHRVVRSVSGSTSDNAEAIEKRNGDSAIKISNEASNPNTDAPEFNRGQTVSEKIDHKNSRNRPEVNGDEEESSSIPTPMSQIRELKGVDENTDESEVETVVNEVPEDDKYRIFQASSTSSKMVAEEQHQNQKFESSGSDTALNTGNSSSLSSLHRRSANGVEGPSSAPTLSNDAQNRGSSSLANSNHRPLPRRKNSVLTSAEISAQTSTVMAFERRPLPVLPSVVQNPSTATAKSHRPVSKTSSGSSQKGASTAAQPQKFEKTGDKNRPTTAAATAKVRATTASTSKRTTAGQVRRPAAPAGSKQTMLRRLSNKNLLNKKSPVGSNFKERVVAALAKNKALTPLDPAATSAVEAGASKLVELSAPTADRQSNITSESILAEDDPHDDDALSTKDEQTVSNSLSSLRSSSSAADLVVDAADNDADVTNTPDPVETSNSQSDDQSKQQTIEVEVTKPVSNTSLDDGEPEVGTAEEGKATENLTVNRSPFNAGMSPRERRPSFALPQPLPQRKRYTYNDDDDDDDGNSRSRRRPALWEGDCARFRVF